MLRQEEARGALRRVVWNHKTIRSRKEAEQEGGLIASLWLA